MACPLQKRLPRLYATLLLAVSFASAVIWPATTYAQVSEYDLAARISYLLAKYTSWPNGPGTGGVALLGVYDNKAAATSFSVLDGEDLHGAKIKVVAIDNTTPPADIDRCAVIFTSDARDLKRVNSATGGSQILVIHLGRTQSDSCVAVYKAGGKLAFDVYYGTLKSRKLRMSSQALRLAGTVHK